MITTKTELQKKIANLEEALEERNGDYTHCRNKLREVVLERDAAREEVATLKELVFYMRRALETYGVRCDE